MFTQKMADENGIARKKAIELLPDHWTATDEKGLPNDKVKDYVRQAVTLVSEEIHREYLPDVPIKRVRSQVTNIMAKERGKLWRKERGL